MRVVVLGCGIIGVTTAWFLRRAGMDVEVVDRAEGPGRETSFANGALLHPSYVAPWNVPGIHWQLLRWIGRQNAPMLIRPRHLSGYLSWGVKFLAHSTRASFTENARRNTELAKFSQTVLAKLRRDLDLNYGSYARGSLMIFREAGAVEAAAKSNELGSSAIDFSVLDCHGTIAVEPALSGISEEIAGSLHFSADEGGDAHRYCVALANCLESEGGRFRFGVEVRGIEQRGNSVEALVTRGNTRIEADLYVLACASETRRLLAPLGIHLPVRPVKGYSVTLPRDGSNLAPTVPVIDADLHAAVVPLGEEAIRVAGTAEFSGEDLSIHDSRIDNLFGLLQQIFPAYASNVSRSSAQAWAGLRPMSADGVPLIGQTRLPNLFVNTGHGQIGWTTGPGSARLLADIILGRRPCIDPEAYAPERFGLMR